MAAFKIPIHLQPRSSKEGVTGWRDGKLWVKIHAAPVDGEANAALLRLLARTFKIPASSIRIASGLKSKDKVLEFLSPDEGLENKIANRNYLASSVSLEKP